MIRSIGKSTKSILLKLLVGILILPFIFWGMGDIFRGGNQNIVATIDSEKIHSQEFVNFVNKLDLNEKQISQLKSSGMLEQILSEYIGKKIIDLEISYYNIVVSDKSLKEMIINDETFHKNGKFSRTEYEKFLITNNLTAPMLEKNIMEQEKKRQLLSYLSDGAVIPNFLIQYEYNKKNQEKQLQYIDLSELYNKKKYSDKEINETFEKNKKFYTEKLKSYSYAILTPKNLNFENNDTQFFKKLDEIENDILDGKSFEKISSENKLPVLRIDNLKLNDLNKEEDKNNSALLSKIFPYEDENKIEFLKVGENFYIVKLEKIDLKQNDLSNKEVKDSIISQLSLVYKLQSNTNIVKEINKNKKDFLKDFSTKNNLLIKSAKIKGVNDKSNFDETIIKKIFEIKDGEIGLITDNSFSKNYLILSEKTKFSSIDKNFSKFDTLEKTTKLGNAQEIYSLYDRNLNNKYEVKVNQKVLDRIKNSF